MKEKLYVPLMNSALERYGAESYFSSLQAISADTVFIALDRACFFARGEDRRRQLVSLAKNLSAFEKKGYTVGVWIQAFGFGDALTGEAKKVAEKYTRLRSVTGKEIPDTDMLCPEDGDFVSDYLELVRDVMGAGCKMLMLDDDLCLSVRPGIGCFCHRHIKLLEEALGESLEGRDLFGLFFTGGKNKYRDAYLSVMGDTHRRFAKAVRDTVDAIDPDVRVGFCAGYTSWDVEGIDACQLTKILAGNTKPFLRFTGAPYWASRTVDRFGGMPLGAIIEEARAQAEYCRGLGIETFFENDSYPRPRYSVPSSLMECFALPLYASGGAGELGYFMDYHSSPAYEQGYIKHRLYNKPLYDFIRKYFSDKTCAGVGVYHSMRKLECAQLTEEDTERTVMRGHFNRGGELLSVHGIPTVYGERAECGIAFGEEARYIDRLPPRLVTDLQGARILAEKGVDTGLVGADVTAPPAFELFGDERVLLSFNSEGRYYKTELKEGAVVVSEFLRGDERFPAAYRYASGERELLVYTFDAGTVSHRGGVFHSYARGDQLAEFCGAFPRIKGVNGIYQIYKKGEDGETALLFVNISEDPVIGGELKLDRTYGSMELCGVEGRLEGDRIVLNTAITPYGAFAVVLR